MIKKNKENNTLFLNVNVAKKLGISNLEEQEVYLNNQKLNVHTIENITDEYYIQEPYNRANRYLEVGGDTFDNFAISKTLISSLNNYQILVHQKTRDYLIDKKFWTKEGLEAFVGEEYFFNDLNAEEIKEKNSLYNLWIQEREFNTNKVSKEIHNLTKKNIFVSEEDFLEKKSTIESNLDIIQILIYLKSLLLKTAKQKNIIIEEDSFDFSKFDISELEYLPFSFQKSDYEKRRNFINNSRQLIDDSYDYELFEQDTNESFISSSHSNENIENNTELLELESFTNESNSLKIAELKPYNDTKLTLEEIDRLEKEFYSAGEINTFDDKDETEHEQIVDIDHVNDEKYNEMFNVHEVKDNNISEREISDLKIGKLLERKYRRHHESPMIVDIENKVDFLMAGYEALDDNDPEVLERNSSYSIDPDDLPIKDLKRRSKKEVQKEENKFDEVINIDSVQKKLDEINELHTVQELEKDDNVLEQLSEEVLVVNENKKSKKQKAKKSLFVKKSKEKNKEVADISKNNDEVVNEEEPQNHIEVNSVNESMVTDIHTNEEILPNKVNEDVEKTKNENLSDELDPFKSINFDESNYMIDLSEKIKLDSEDFETKTQEVENKTLELINELSEEKSKKKKKGWLFSKKNK